MRQVTGLTSTYSSDVFGICSALYELGGMVVMHDASGCNSTYTTHDEPRWYDMDSMIYVSAISEKEAILGDDEKLIGDLIDTARELNPKFIAVVDAPIPYMIGTDLRAISQIVSAQTGIPCFAFYANGMHDYTCGVSKAMEEIVRAFAIRCGKAEREAKAPLTAGEAVRPTVNLLGVTPLDFSVNGGVEAMQRWVGEQGMKNGVSLAMGCTLEEIARLPDADVNLVVSSGGWAAAKLLRERCKTPCVVGVPFGKAFSEYLADAVRTAAAAGESGIACRPAETAYGKPCFSADEASENRFERNGEDEKAPVFVIIGEPVTSASLAAAIGMECGVNVRVLCPLESEPELLRPGDRKTPEEDDLIREIGKADAVIADPLYQPLCGEKRFYPLPHTAFSGRIYEKEIPVLIAVPLGGQTETGQ